MTLRVVLPCVDELQWSQLSAGLNSARLGPYGCLSWHSRRSGPEVRVTALWHDRRSLQIFVSGLLADVARAAGLAPPTVSITAVAGVFGMAQQPFRRSAPVAAAAVPLQPARIAATAVPPQRQAA
jgi:hypothetical protein